MPYDQFGHWVNPPGTTVTTTGNTTMTYTYNSSNIWQGWVTTSISTISTQYIWDQWMTYTDMGTGTVTHTYNGQPYVPTPEEQARLLVQREESAARAAVLNEYKEAARTRARSLLYDLLTPEQLETLEKNKHIPVVGSKGRKYCIRATGRSGNVQLLGTDGKVQASFCGHTVAYDLPLEDEWTAQLLHLMADEDDFITKANLSSGTRPFLEAPMRLAA